MGRPPRARAARDGSPDVWTAGRRRRRSVRMHADLAPISPRAAAGKKPTPENAQMLGADRFVATGAGQARAPHVE